MLVRWKFQVLSLTAIISQNGMQPRTMESSCCYIDYAEEEKKCLYMGLSSKPIEMLS